MDRWLARLTTEVGAREGTEESNFGFDFRVETASTEPSATGTVRGPSMADVLYL
jgi:hypothetical protein